jgi:SPP1 family predicted phage head-tail adaptor
MFSGKRRARLSFEKRSAISDGYGNQEGDWVAQFTVSGAIRPLRGSETVIAQRLAGVQPVIINVWRSSLTQAIASGWRAIELGTSTTYNIRAIADMTQNGRELEIMAEAGVAT